jgi:hypothetical protein
VLKDYPELYERLRAEFSGANPHDLRDVSSITTELLPVRMVVRLTMMVACRHLSASLTIQLADLLSIVHTRCCSL